MVDGQYAPASEQVRYINTPGVPETPESWPFEVIDPSDENPFAVISLGTKADLDKAVTAARAAFDGWSRATPEERLDLLEVLAAIYERRSTEMADAISTEMGAPRKLAVNAQAAVGLSHIREFIRAIKGFRFEHPLRDDAPDEYIIHEPIGVCGLITPWNWPMN